MSETPEPATEPVVPAAPAEPVAVERKPNRLYQVAAWVAIVAGTLVIVAVIFFAGFILGKASDGGHGHFGHHHPGMMMKPDRGGPMGPPMMRPDGFREGHMWPGPGNMGPGGPGPADQPRPAGPPRPTDQRDSGR